MPRNWQSGKPRKRNKKSKCKRAEWKKKKEALLETCRTNLSDVSRDEWQDRNVSPQPGPSGLHNQMNHSPTSLSNLNVSGIEELPDSDQEYWAEIPITRDTNIKEMNELLSGRRVVNIVHMLSQLTTLATHGRICTEGRFLFHSEKRIGIVSHLIFKCLMCEETRVVKTEVESKEEELNDEFVWGALSIGIGHQQAQEMMALMEVPIMDKKKWRRHEQRIETVWEEKLEECMRQNGVREREIALEKGHVDADGFPFITVYQDGGWCTRSYGHAYNASSGVACIIGAATNGLLYIGVKNKYCYICSQTEPGKESKEHKCYKNYQGTSTGMEQAILVQGFRESERMHNLRYKYIVSDGDSSTYAKIQRNVAYGRQVIKLECANHMVRNYTDKLHKIIKDTAHDITARKELSQLIPRLTKVARAAITDAGDNVNNSDVLRDDLRNGPYHVFGQHSNCRDTYCKRKEGGEINKVPMMSPTSVWSAIMKALDPLVIKADKLVGNHTTNQAERYMSLVSKFSGGKRTDVSKSGRYKRCCLAAGLSHTGGPNWHASPLKRLIGYSPGRITKNIFATRSRAVQSHRKRKASRHLPFGTPKTNKKQRTGTDTDYGPEAEQPDISEEQMAEKKEEILSRLGKEVATENLCNELERRTLGQSSNITWREARLNRLTASIFAKVCKMREDTACHNTVVGIVNPKEVNTEMIKYGRINETTAIKKYEDKFKENVVPCGLFVNTSFPYLGASPDGLVGDDTIIEVKCLPSLNKLKLDKPNIQCIRDACKVKNVGLRVNDENNLILNKTHPYFYQIQGQLNITKRKVCILIIFCDFDVEYVKVERDQNFWVKEMLPKLKRFYMECILPEIVDPRHVRGMRCRDPLYIKKAMEKKRARK